jgi:hypothetical protein
MNHDLHFDEVSAVYAKFGQFFISVRLPVEKLSGWLEGKIGERRCLRNSKRQLAHSIER